MLKIKVVKSDGNSSLAKALGFLSHYDKNRKKIILEPKNKPTDISGELILFSFFIVIGVAFIL